MCTCSTRGRKLWGYRTNLFRRMHRKIVVVDGDRAFVGGLNFSADHLADFGPQAKLDHAIEIEGPLVAEIQRFAHDQLGERGAASGAASGAAPQRQPVPPPRAAAAQTRCSSRATTASTRNDIERHYRIAIRAARKRVWIAVAYFFPGYRLLHELRKAARRGVDVRLILQGEPDMPIVKVGASMLYHHLLRAGVHIHEYCEKPLHSKVALDRRRMGDRRLEQPRSAEPGAESGGQRDDPRSRLQSRACASGCST